MRLFKRLFIGGAVAYIILCLFALLFYKERMVLPDDSNYIFDLVTNGGHYAVFHYRFIAILTQWLPYSAIKLDMSLDSVTWLYSLNLMLYYAGCYLLCGLAFRNYKAAVALVVSYLLFTSHTFYWTVSELGQGIALSFVAFSVISNEPEKGIRNDVIRFLLLAVLVITCAYAHGLTFFVQSFLLLYLLLHRPENWRWVATTACLFFVALIYKRLFLLDQYDREAMGGLKNFIRLYPNYFNTESMRYLAAQFVGAYSWVPIILLINSIYYITRKKWLKQGLMMAYTLGYLMLTTVSFPNLEGNGFYHENLFLPLGVFLCVPFVYDVLPAIKKPVLAGGLVALILASGILRIWQYHRPYSARLAWQRGIMNHYDGRKVILPASDYPKETLLMAWSSPYEFWLLSTIEQGKTASIIVTDNPDLPPQDAQLFITTFNTYKYQQMPPRYFVFQDTLNTYEFIR